MELLHQPNSYTMKTQQTGQATTNPEPLVRDPVQISPAHLTFDCAGPSWDVCVCGWVGRQVGRSGRWDGVKSVHNSR